MTTVFVSTQILVLGDISVEKTVDIYPQGRVLWLGYQLAV
jgi:hypothetical protein